MIAAARVALPPRHTLRALTYLDWQLFLNRLRTIRRDPKRLWIWIFFAVFLLFAFGQRLLITRSLGRYPPALTTFVQPFVAFVPGLALLILGAVVAFAQRAVGLFQSAADARFLCGSALPPRAVILWLYFRMLRRLVVQLPALAIWFVFLASSLTGALAGIFRFWLSISLFFALPLVLNLPLVKLHARRPRLLRLAGLAIAALGVASLAAAIAPMAHYPAPPVLRSLLLALPPGSWIVGGFTGDWPGVIALAVCASAGLALSIAEAGDVYPEVWQSSLRMITVRRLMRQRGGVLTARETREALRSSGVASRPARPAIARSAGGMHVPAGAWTLLWKEWLATLRMRGGLRLPLGLGIGAILIGWAAGGGFGRLAPLVTVNLLILPIYLLLFINVFMSFRLGVDLRNPLWWLSSATLRARLYVLTLGRCLRQVIPLAVGLLAAAVAARSPTVFVLGLPAFAVMIWALQAMGIGVYTVIPSPSDLRGPGQLLRMLLLFGLLLPVLIVFTVAAAATRHLSISLVAAAVSLGLEGVGLLSFAAHRLQGNGLAFAQAERR